MMSSRKFNVFTCHRDTPNWRQQSCRWPNCKFLPSLKQIHASLIVKGFNSCRTSLRDLIYLGAVGVSGAIGYAHQMFAQITEPDTFMWSTMMRGSAQSQNPLKAIYLYTRMENCGSRADSFMFLFQLKACTRLEWRNTGFGFHGKVVRYGFEASKFVRHSLIYFHAKCGDLAIARSIFDHHAGREVVAWSALTAGYAMRGNLGEARQLFDKMPVKDLVSWNVMITGYVKGGDMESARKLFDEVPERDVVTWNAMIAGYVDCGEHEHALQMFEEMRSVGECPDEVTMLSLLSACTDLGDLEVGRKVHSSILQMTRGDFSVLHGNALIYMYSKCGSIEEALDVFRRMRQKNVSTWNSVICGLAFHGHADEAIKTFLRVLRFKHIKPDEFTFAGVLVACSHAGKVEEGYRYFDLMRDYYNIEPNVKHYGCMVDLLGRAGLLNEAFEFIDKMKAESNPIIWRTLLGACRIHGNVELGRRANEMLLKMQMDESGDYVLLSNIYASVGEWDGAERVRRKMDESGVKKEVGFSLIDADSRSWKFLFDSKPKSNS